MENRTEEAREKGIKLLRKELSIRRSLRTEKNRPTLWINKDNSQIEIHFNNKTILAKITGIDKEIKRGASDDMAEGSNYKQIPYKNDNEIKEVLNK